MHTTNMRTPLMLLCCGCFNPVTNKHLRLMELARDALHKTGRYTVTKGVFSPASDQYNKKGLVNSKHRLEMLRLAVKRSSWLSVDSWECEQPEWTRTRVVLDHHQEFFNASGSSSANHPSSSCTPGKRPRLADAELCSEAGDGAPTVKLICGADLLESFATPNLWSSEDVEHIVKTYGLVVISRAGSQPEKFIYEDDILAKHSYNIHLVTDWFGDDFSATKVRRAIGRQESVKYVIPDSVIDYIKQNEIYGQYKPEEDS